MHIYLPLLLARAGGGHSFSGGGSSGGGFSGGGSGGHYVGGAYVAGGAAGSSGGLGIGGMIVILFVVAFIAFVIYRQYKNRGGWSSSGYQGEGQSYIPEAPMNVDLESIKAHDPGFNEEEFLAQTQRAFFMVQEAWTERTPKLSRAVMDDELWESHRMQIQGYIDAHKRNVLEQLSIGSEAIVHAESAGGYDTITVRILAACADYDVNDEGKRVRGNDKVNQWQEDWVFHRASTAVTKPDGGIRAMKCPNCGGPLELDPKGTCKYCHSLVMSGAYDWVLTRINQIQARAA